MPLPVHPDRRIAELLRGDNIILEAKTRVPYLLDLQAQTFLCQQKPFLIRLIGTQMKSQKTSSQAGENISNLARGRRNTTCVS